MFLWFLVAKCKDICGFPQVALLSKYLVFVPYPMDNTSCFPFQNAQTYLRQFCLFADESVNMNYDFTFVHQLYASLI